MGLYKVADNPVVTAVLADPLPEVTTMMMKRLGSAYFKHKVKEETADKASSAIDYLVEEGVLPNA